MSDNLHKLGLINDYRLVWLVLYLLLLSLLLIVTYAGKFLVPLVSLYYYRYIYNFFGIKARGRAGSEV